MNANLILYVRSFDLVLGIYRWALWLDLFFCLKSHTDWKREMKKNDRNDRDNEMEELEHGKYIFDLKEFLKRNK